MTDQIKNSNLTQSVKISSSIKSWLSSLGSPSLKYEIKHQILAIKNFFCAMKWWEWKEKVFVSETAAITVHYLGRNAAQLAALLGVDASLQAAPDVDKKMQLRLTDFPVPRAYPIPGTLTTIVPLNRSLDEILASYGSSLRRAINKQRKTYRYEVVCDVEKIIELNQSMLQPYADAKHENACHVDANALIKVALSENGRFYVLYCDDEPVGCHFANFYERNGKKYWHVNRFGYPESVFSDFKRWGEVNSMNLHLALEAAIEAQFDFCDYGTSLAKPGSGLIEWKRRRKGFVAQDGGINFYLTLPKTGLAQFFWDSPLFSLEKGRITLHLGIPAGKTDEEVLEKYHEMGYLGLYKVYLNCIAEPSPTLIENMRQIFAEEQNPPMIITYFVP